MNTLSSRIGLLTESADGQLGLLMSALAGAYTIRYRVF
ncbi:hypothetical protein ABIB73_000805 [Bradyrhizobium sp. F1.4.3]